MNLNKLFWNLLIHFKKQRVVTPNIASIEYVTELMGWNSVPVLHGQLMIKSFFFFCFFYVSGVVDMDVSVADMQTEICNKK